MAVTTAGGAFPAPNHDHQVCISTALDRASELCAQRGQRLTKTRRRVLELVWSSHSPVGAYDLLQSLNADGARALPMTVYRALEFLLAQGLIHRLESRKAFVGCARPEIPHEAQFFICRQCGTVAKVLDPEIERAIRRRAERAGFAVAASMVEVEGICPHCRGRPDAGGAAG